MFISRISSVTAPFADGSILKYLDIKIKQTPSEKEIPNTGPPVKFENTIDSNNKGKVQHSQLQDFYERQTTNLLNGVKPKTNKINL